MASETNNMDGALHGFFGGIVIASIFWLLFLLISNEDPRRGYFYVSSEYQGTVIRMNNMQDNATDITEPMSSDDAIRICDGLNKLIESHANSK